MSDVKDVQDSATPAHGQQVITAVAFIHHNFDGVEKVFMPKRAATKKFLPDVYELVGGHIDFGEDLAAGLKREVEEEINKPIRVGDVVSAFTYINDIKGSHSIEVCFFAEFESEPENITLNPQDHSTYGWFAADEVAGILDPDDDELGVIAKAFALLAGGHPAFS